MSSPAEYCAPPPKCRLKPIPLGNSGASKGNPWRPKSHEIVEPNPECFFNDISSRTLKVEFGYVCVRNIMEAFFDYVSIPIHKT